MIKYDDIKLTAFCDTATMDKLEDFLPNFECGGIRSAKYEIVTVFESSFCEPGVLVVLKDAEYEKLQEYKRGQEELNTRLNTFNNLIDSLGGERTQ